MTSIVDDAPSLDGFGAGVSPEELRRLRRTISNRESARRCRLRKQRRLEELREQASVLRSENRDLSGRLGGIARRCLLVHWDNNRLLAEASALGRRLADLRRVAAPPPPLPGDYY
ncbi:Basic region leucine zipper [Musa troglodytarum]|uniref:Basic region leucine zipper n=1 Tax=Musa troglodytarum TaxID=320322 RepID=A0A9E7K7C8_9LILI|nr:Basic region leucine zipper [Musa troglodytarum]